MTVPFSDAVARSVPEALRERKEMGALCAWMTLETVRERVEKRRTSPDWWGAVVAEPAVAAVEEAEVVVVEVVEAVDVVVEGLLAESWEARGEFGEGTGEGYARYDESAEGERAHIARNALH
jgi:hypothetical protein